MLTMLAVQLKRPLNALPYMSVLKFGKALVLFCFLQLFQFIDSIRFFIVAEIYLAEWLCIYRGDLLKFELSRLEDFH